jgi:hypothetical protein
VGSPRSFIRTDIRTKPPSISRAVSSQAVRVSSSFKVTEQTEIDLQPEVVVMPRSVEESETYMPSTTAAIIGFTSFRSADPLAFGGERDDQAERTEDSDADDVPRQPLDIAPRLQEDAQNTQVGDAHDQPAQEGSDALERLAGDPGDPQAIVPAADRLDHDTARQES